MDSIINYAEQRYTTKAYDPTKKISKEHIEAIKKLLQLSPSSLNLQPWYFLLASTKEAKQKIVKSMVRYTFNTQAILDASHVLIMCTRRDINKKYLTHLLEEEEASGRMAKVDPVEFKKMYMTGIQGFINLHKYDLKDFAHWLDKQVYINLGTLLLGVSTLGIDATPMEGFDPRVIDEEFNLREKFVGSLLLVPLGYRDLKKDYNADLPKSRHPIEDILIEV